MNTQRLLQRTHSPLLLTLLCSVLVFSGCGGGGGGSFNGDGGLAEYNFGYDDGYADNSEYFLGYDESFLNEGDGESWYSGDLIPFLDELSYDAGFYDGQFEAYNDGYFVAYRFAFIIGFSEGYDNAYWDDYLDFLANDWHVELSHAGFSDGYNDGFSEGRIFGAYDYEAFLSFDWFDAFLDWESGTDLYFEEVDKGTGIYSYVVLYEWGQNPHILEAFGLRGVTETSSLIKMRADGDTATRSVGVSTIEVARDLTAEQASLLDVNPLTTSRTDRDLALSTTWRERIDLYQNQVQGLTAKTHTTRTGVRVKK